MSPKLIVSGLGFHLLLCGHEPLSKLLIHNRRNEIKILQSKNFSLVYDDLPK